MNPTILPAMNRNTPFAIPDNTSLRYDIIMLEISQNWKSA